MVTFPNSIVATGSETEQNLDKVVQKYCPDTVTYSKNTVDGKIAYTFALEFNSLNDYTTKTSDIIQNETVINFANPDNAMTTGWRLSESFESTELLSWISEGARKEKLENLNFNFNETKTTANFNGDKHNTETHIAVNVLNGYPIQKIQISTVNKGSVFDRQIKIFIAQSTFDSLKDTATNYFKSVTDTSATSEWLIENNSYIYNVKFVDLSLRQLEGYTNKLLSSVYCESAYEDKSVGSNALASQNSYTETLDFSNYVGNSNSNVPVEYKYSIASSSELSECQIYDGKDWVAATDLLSDNKYGSLVAIKINEPLVTLKINDGKQYTASSINVNVTPLDDDKVQKSVVFKYDIATGGNESSAYTKSYFDSLGIGAVEAIDGDKKTCTITFSGTDEEINTKMQELFGVNNKMRFSSYHQFMTLRSMKQLTDSVDFSSLIIGKNIDTPVNYSVTPRSGDILKSFDSKDKNGLTPDENGVYTIQLSSPSEQVTYDVSVANISDIIVFIVISCIIVVIAVAILLFMKSRQTLNPLPQGEETTALPKEKKSMIPHKNKKDITKPKK